ncbi:MAG: C45 family peptidase [Anaerolineae bacterium]|nr:C45 family peptidase [Anaerolineae bacterium]
MPPIRVLKLSGSPYEMGYQHGLAYANEIRDLTEERIRLCSDETWTGRTLACEEALALAQSCLEAHQNYAPDQMEQLEGIAAATGLSVVELLITNGFTDLIDVIYNASDAPSTQPSRIANDCTSFMVGQAAADDGHSMLGQTWDMHATATPHVLLIQSEPDSGPAFLAFSVTGCVAMIGLNEAGIAVGINNLVGADGAPGVTWPFVCRKILSQTHIDDALACITDAPLAGSHNYLLLDSEGHGYNIEAMTTATHITELSGDVLAHANQCLAAPTQAVERPPSDEAIEDSQTRVNRALTVLEQRSLNPEALMDLTRDRSDGAYSVCSISQPPYYSETCGAVVMRPATREFWGVWGLPIHNAYEHFVL